MKQQTRHDVYAVPFGSYYESWQYQLHRKPKVVELPTLSSLEAPEVVVTTSGAPSEDKVGIMKVGFHFWHQDISPQYLPQGHPLHMQQTVACECIICSHIMIIGAIHVTL